MSEIELITKSRLAVYASCQRKHQDESFPNPPKAGPSDNDNNNDDEKQDASSKEFPSVPPFPRLEAKVLKGEAEVVSY